MGIRSLAAELLPSALQGLQRAVSSAPPKPPELAPSFATLTEQLGYLSKADNRKVREAYKFADDAHLGQFRASGEPYITHPIAVAGAVRRVEARRAGDHGRADARRDGGLRRHQGRADRAVRRAHRRTRRRPDQAGQAALPRARKARPRSFRKMLLAMARDVRVILIKLADRLHNMRTMHAMAAEKRQRIARETLDIYAPIAHRLGLNQTYRELQELSLRAPVPVAPRGAGQGGAARARPPPRHRRARAARRREVVLEGEDQGPGIGPREDRLFDLPQDAREARRLRAGQRHLRLPHRGADAAGVLSGAGRAAPAVQAGAGTFQGLHRDPEGQRLPVAAHHAGQPAGHGGRVPDPHRGHACGRRNRHRRALAVQGQRQGRQPGRRGRSAWARCGCSR